MGLNNGLLIADVMHKRHHPKVNAFCYKVYYLTFALSQVQALKNAVLSINRFNLFSFYAKDHGKRDGNSLEAFIRQTLKDFDITEAEGGEVVLLTLPRVLGHVFNPVSFWFCLDKAGELRAVLSEVSNTFGEHHNYIAFHDDKRIITQDEWIKGEKVFHVSPFMDVEGYYQYRFAYKDNAIGVWIDHYNEHGLMLSTSLTGRRNRLTARTLFKAFSMYPLITLKVIGLIHYQAIKILLKGIKYRKKPHPPLTEISR